MNVPFLRPTWADIDLTSYKRNLQKIRAEVGARVKILAVLKADAYGHGAVRLGQYAQAHRLCNFFGAASVEEGIILRESGITLPILVLGSLYPFEAFEYAAKYDLSVAVASLEAAKAVKQIAHRLGRKIRCHVKQDSGMGRIGTRRGAVLSVIEELSNDELISLEGVFTHLSSVDTDPQYTDCQLEAFTATVSQVRARRLPLVCHAAASPAITLRPDCCFDMVRSGHAALGLADGYEPVLSFKTRIVFAKEVEAGASISYNRSFIAPKTMKIATLPVGYGDGYPRALSNKASILIRGIRCPVLGNITMDMCMVDVSSVSGVRVGDEAVLIGRQGTEEIRAAELASLAGTIDYELTTALMPRVPRFYKE